MSQKGPTPARQTDETNAPGEDTAARSVRESIRTTRQQYVSNSSHSCRSTKTSTTSKPQQFTPSAAPEESCQWLIRPVHQSPAGVDCYYNNRLSVTSGRGLKILSKYYKRRSSARCVGPPP